MKEENLSLSKSETIKVFEAISWYLGGDPRINKTCLRSLDSVMFTLI